jgi:hypothetical protein
MNIGKLVTMKEIQCEKERLEAMILASLRTFERRAPGVVVRAVTLQRLSATTIDRPTTYPLDAVRITVEVD